VIDLNQARRKFLSIFIRGGQNMKYIIFPLFFTYILTLPHCNGKKKSFFKETNFAEIGSSTGSLPVLPEDEYLSVELDPEGKLLLYIVQREVKEGWGLGHGNELVSYDLSKKMKLPLGKIGRSTLVKFIVIKGEIKNAVVKTVDTDGNGDIDERDANQLYISTIYGLDEEPVSQIGKNVIGVWQDPLEEWVVFATSDDWQGRKRRAKEKPPDPTPVVWAWDPVTKGTTKLGVCEVFYGFSPDGNEIGCLLSGQNKIQNPEIAIMDRITRKNLSKFSLTVKTTDQIFLLGGGKIAFTREEISTGGKRTTIWIREKGGTEKRITNQSVNSHIIAVLRDGSLVFESRAIDTIQDFIALRALSPDGKTIKTIFYHKGKEIEMLSISPSLKNIAYLENLTSGKSQELVQHKTKIFLSELKGKAEEVPASKIANEYIQGISESLLATIKNALGKTDFVEINKAWVDVPNNTVYLPINNSDTTGKTSPDTTLLQKALEIKKLLSPQMMESHPEIIIFSSVPDDAYVSLKYSPESGSYFTFFEGYGESIPVREEYNITIEDLRFRKMPGCMDPRLIQLHCGGWLTSLKPLTDENITIKCRAEPLNPMQITREETLQLKFEGSGGEAVPFEVVVDKVDPRRSMRYSYYLEILSNNKKIPYYDALWAQAQTAWIELMRKLRKNLPSDLIPYAGRNETIKAKGKWHPDSVVNRETHLDVHLFLEQSNNLPSPDSKDQWDKLADFVMDEVTKHTSIYDEGREKDVRVTLYAGNQVVAEKWHKSAAEIIEEKMLQNPDWQPPIPGEKSTKKPKTKEEKELVELMNEAIGSVVPPSKLGLPKAMLDRNEVQKVISSHLKEIKHCYEAEALSRDLGSGQITVRFVVDSSGKVKSVDASSDTLKNERVTQCVLKAVMRWKFPKPSGEGDVTLTYPFTFTHTPM